MSQLPWGYDCLLLVTVGHEPSLFLGHFLSFFVLLSAKSCCCCCFFMLQLGHFLVPFWVVFQLTSAISVPVSCSFSATSCVEFLFRPSSAPRNWLYFKTRPEALGPAQRWRAVVVTYKEVRRSALHLWPLPGRHGSKIHWTYCHN